MWGERLLFGVPSRLRGTREVAISSPAVAVLVRLGKCVGRRNGAKEERVWCGEGQVPGVKVVTARCCCLEMLLCSVVWMPV